MGTKLPSSFRDASGHMFQSESIFYRMINVSYRDIFDRVTESGLYEALAAKNWLVKHSDVEPWTELGSGESKIIRPDQLEFISYPYEWSFSQLKESALLTLKICEESLKRNFVLKDASAYNVQLHKGDCLFIDSLSFEDYAEGSPWIAYRQFINHFLNPLLLMSHVDPSFNSLLKVHLDGIPSLLASKLLPKKTYLSPVVLSNVHLHAMFEKKYEDKPGSATGSLPKSSLLAILETLHGFIDDLKPRADKTEWGNYYSETNYSEASLEEKERLVLDLVSTFAGERPRVLDLGANSGKFSRVLARKAELVISADVDPLAIEKNYLANKKNACKNVYPILLDFTNPSPSLGWNCEERLSFFERCHSDLTVCLAFVHHMVISHNIAFELLAKTLAKLSGGLIIEFVDPEDSQVKRLKASKKANHPYDQDRFEAAFSKEFSIVRKIEITDTLRTLYFMQSKANRKP